MTAMTVKPDVNTLGVAALWRALGQSVVQPCLWCELASAYAAQELPWQAGYAARQAMRLDGALLPRLEALALGDWRDATLGDALLGRALLENARPLAVRFFTAVQACEGDWLSWLYLARLQEMLPASESGSDLPARGVALQQACVFEPIAGESLHWSGVWRLNAGDAAGAVAAFSKLLDIRPVRHGSMMYLGEALLQVGNIIAAEKAFARAALSDNPDFLQMLAPRLYARNYWVEATKLLQKALVLRPGNVPLLLALAKIQSEVYALSDCRESLRQVLSLEPDNLDARMLFAGLQGRMGDAQGHLQTLRAAYEAGGDPLSRLASSLAMTMLYQDDLSAEAVALEHVRLCAPIEAEVQPCKTFSLRGSKERPLRVGYVTGDLHRQHPVNVFMLPVLLRQKNTDMTIYIYHTGTMHDAYTLRAKECADRWVEAARLDDKGLHKIILDDEVDVLVDLAGHTATHRLGVFAMRAAPVQATFLGYPHSTGLTTMDWLIGDATVSPAEHADLFSEGLAQLPGSVFCWAPVDAYPLPAARAASAPVVFGSFNNAMKLTPRTVALWSRVLQAVPGSQLLLKAPSLRDQDVQARFSDLFLAQGIGADRLIMRGPSGLADMMQEYGDMDIALDPTPYNGGTTSLQALWMGVPLVALEGENFVGRMGASFLTTMGRREWLAEDEATYVDIAVRLAADCATLRQQRGLLRSQMEASALCDIEAYVVQFSSLLRKMWESYCDDKPLRLLPARLEHFHPDHPLALSAVQMQNGILGD